MPTHSNEPREPNVPGPEPDYVPQPEHDGVELPPREDQPLLQAGKRQTLLT